MRNGLIIFSILLFLSFHLSAQELHYFIGFTDKSSTSFTLDRPEEFLSQKSLLRRTKQNISLTERDLPVSAAYLAAIRATGAKVIYTSKWVNAALVEATVNQIDEIRAFEFTKELPYVTRGMQANSLSTQEQEAYGASFGQADMIGLDDMHEMGYTGAGIEIAILDGGFRNADTDQSFKDIFESERLLSTFDFVDGDENVYEASDHGRQVFSITGSFQAETMIGGAYGASFHLFRTENTAVETRLEEIYWLLAAEKADSLGVDIILSSLGYTTFDLDEDSYTVEALDGNTALVTVAADLAASTGMLVVTSAGNEGNDPWQKITSPADADSVLSVGAVNQNGEYMEFSSLGPTANGRIKPEVAAQGWFTIASNGGGGTRSTIGTSFAAPLVASLAAGLWQARPELNNMDIIRILKATSSQAENPDNLLGYGIPDFNRALEYEEVTALNAEGTLSDPEIYPNPFEVDFSIVFPENEVGQKIDILIFSTEGKVLFEETQFLKSTTSKIRFPESIKGGVYILKLESLKGFRTFRIIKSYY